MMAPGPVQRPWSLPVGVLGLDDAMRICGADGRVFGCVVLHLTLFIRRGDRPDVRTGIVRAYEAYRKAAGSVFQWGIHPQTGKVEPLTQSNLGEMSQWPGTWLRLYDFQAIFGGSDAQDGGVDPYRFSAVAREEEPGELSFCPRDAARAVGRCPSHRRICAARTGVLQRPRALARLRGAGHRRPPGRSPGRQTPVRRCPSLRGARSRIAPHVCAVSGHRRSDQVRQLAHRPRARVDRSTFGGESALPAQADERGHGSSLLPGETAVWCFRPDPCHAFGDRTLQRADVRLPHRRLCGRSGRRAQSEAAERPGRLRFRRGHEVAVSLWLTHQVLFGRPQAA